MTDGPLTSLAKGAPTNTPLTHLAAGNPLTALVQTTQAAKVEAGDPGGEPIQDSPGNPIAYVGGAIWNTAVHGIPNVVSGVQALGSALIHDAGGAVLQAIPGEQGGWERDIEQQGYTLPKIADAAPGAIVDDYAGRYGLHGFEEAKDSFYNDPLAYILDVVGAGAAVKTGAKLGHAAGLVGDATLASVAGITEEAASNAGFFGKLPKAYDNYGAIQKTGREVVETLADGSVLDAPVSPLKLSHNPVVRTVQHYITDKYLSRAASEVDAAKLTEMLGPNASLWATEEALKNLGVYAENGVRVLRTVPNRYVGSKFATIMSGTAQTNFFKSRDAGNGALRSFEDAQKEKYAHLLVGEDGEPLNRLDDMQVDTIQGLRSPMQNTDPIASVAVDHGPIPLIPQDTPIQPTIHIGDIGQPAADVDSFQAAVNAVGAKQVRATVATFGDSTPGVGKLALDIGVDDIVTAPQAATRIAERWGGEVVGVMDTLGETDIPEAMKSLRYVVQKGDERLVLNVGTPELLKGQELASHALGTVPALTEELTKTQQIIHSMQRAAEAGIEGDKALGGGVVDIAGQGALTKNLGLADYIDQAARLTEEIEAATHKADLMWRYPTRLMTKGYTDAGLEALDFSHQWEYEFGQKAYMNAYAPMKGPDGWLEHGMQGPMANAMDRAFGPLQVTLFKGWENDYRLAAKGIIKDITKRVQQNPGRPNYDAINAEFRKLLIQAASASPIGMDRSAIEAMIGLKPWDLSEGPAKLVQKLHWDFHMAFRDRAILDGDFGLDWRSLDAATPKGLTPNYFAHIPQADIKASDYLDKMKSLKELNTLEPRFQKGWKGVLFEQGNYVRNLDDVYSRVSTMYARHQQILDLVDQVKRKFGRRLSPEELLQVEQVGKWTKSGEVLWAPYGIQKDLSFHASILDDIASHVTASGDYDKAVLEVITKRSDDLMTMQLDKMKNAEVYAIPEYVAKKFEQHVKHAWSSAGIQMFYDGPMNLWRSAVLGLNPRWFLYNAMGNIAFTGIKNPMALVRAYTQLGKKNEAMFNFVLGEENVASLAEGGFMEREATLNKARKAIQPGDPYGKARAVQEAVKASGPGRFMSRWSQGIMNLNAELEQAARRGIALDVAAKGRISHWTRAFGSDLKMLKGVADGGIDADLAEEMFRQVNGTLGDYQTLGVIERQYVRRFLMPFYPFYRHIVKFSLKMPYENPLKSIIFRNLNLIDQEIAQERPDFLQGAVAMGEMGGKDAFLRLQNINPLDFFTNPRGQALNLLSPVLNTFVNSQTGLDQLGRPYEDENVYEAPGTGLNVKDGEVFEGAVHPPWIDMIADNFPQAQLLNTIIPQAPGYEPEKTNKTPLTTLLGMLGVPLSRYDLDSYQLRAMEAKMTALLNGNR